MFHHDILHLNVHKDRDFKFFYNRLVSLLNRKNLKSKTLRHIVVGGLSDFYLRLKEFIHAYNGKTILPFFSAF